MWKDGRWRTKHFRWKFTNTERSCWEFLIWKKKKRLGQVWVEGEKLNPVPSCKFWTSSSAIIILRKVLCCWNQFPTGMFPFSFWLFSLICALIGQHACGTREYCIYKMKFHSKFNKVRFCKSALEFEVLLSQEWYILTDNLKYLKRIYKLLHKIQQMKHNRFYSKQRIMQLKMALKVCVFSKMKGDGRGLAIPKWP